MSRRTLIRLLTRVAVVALVASMITGIDLARPSTPVSADPGTAQPLLLIHGFTDNCASAFAPGVSGLTDAQTYLNDAKFSTETIGYYLKNSDGTTAKDTYACNRNLNQMAGADPHMNECNALSDAADVPQNSAAYGTKDDRIDRLGCLLAWYIFDYYTRYGRAVNVLAHSMGGLIIRDAIGRTSAGAAHFPRTWLSVLRVVTVATPHGGIDGEYYDYAAQDPSMNGQELADMKPGSAFMNLIGGYQAPQGTGGTRWSLMGASDGPYYGVDAEPALKLMPDSCPPGDSSWPYDGPNKISCGGGDGDGVVPLASQMAMKADYKIAYGSRGVFTPVCYIDDMGMSHSCVVIDMADPSTQYEHERLDYPTDPPCWDQDLYTLFGQTLFATICYHGPFYLNDSGTTTTTAWVCGSSCSDTSIPSTKTTGVSRSLATIVNRLNQQVTTPVPATSALVLRSAPVANSLFVSAELGYTGSGYAMMRARSSSLGSWESWTKVSLPGGLIALRNNANSKYASADPGTSELHASAAQIGENEVFSMTYNSDGTYSLRTARLIDSNNRYVSAELGFTGSTYGELRARATAIGSWEKYYTGSLYLAPTVSVVENNTSNCPGTQQYFNDTDANGVPVQWTYANSSYTCVTVDYSPTELDSNCNFYFYVPKGDATANVVFTIQYLDLDILRTRTITLDESPVDGWQLVFTGYDVLDVRFHDKNGQDYSLKKQLGWGRYTDHGLRQDC